MTVWLTVVWINMNPWDFISNNPIISPLKRIHQVNVQRWYVQTLVVKKDVSLECCWEIIGHSNSCNLYFIQSHGSLFKAFNGDSLSCVINNLTISSKGRSICVGVQLQLGMTRVMALLSSLTPLESSKSSNGSGVP